MYICNPMKFDLRYLQILFLTSFLAYGIRFLNWDISIEKISWILFISSLTQGLFCLAFKIPVNAMKSAIITALGISILMRSDYIFIYGMAGFFSIASKYIFKVNGKHFFNPANFGISFIIISTGIAWLSAEHWDTIATISFALLGIGLVALTNRRKIDIIGFFLLFYVGLGYLWEVWGCGKSSDNYIHDISQGVIVFFTFFMIVDPSSTPNARISRILWVAMLSILSIYLQIHFHIFGAPIFALFLMSFTTPLLDAVFKNESKFSWDSMYRRILHSNAE